jgi:hypothetical protein
MISIGLLVLASATMPQTITSFDAVRALDRATLVNLVGGEQFNRVKRLFPKARYFKRAEPDCELSTDAPPGKIGCDELYVYPYRFADGDDYYLTLYFDWKRGLSSITLSTSDADLGRAGERADLLQLMLRYHYGHEVCRLGAECYYGSDRAGHVELSQFRIPEADATISYSTSVEIRPPSRRRTSDQRRSRSGAF